MVGFLVQEKTLDVFSFFAIMKPKGVVPEG
jgi:hypothetical protein